MKAIVLFRDEKNPHCLGQVRISEVVPMTGIELVTYALRMRCSTN